MPTPISLVVTETEDSTVTVTIDAILAALRNETLTIGPSGGFIVQQGADISFPGYHATHNYDMFIDDIVPNTDNSVTFGRGGSHEDGARYLREVYSRALFTDLINTEGTRLTIGGTNKTVAFTGLTDFNSEPDFNFGFNAWGTATFSGNSRVVFGGSTEGISYDDLDDIPVAVDLTAVNNTLTALREELGTRPASNNIVWEQIGGLQTTIQGQQTAIESLDTAANLNTGFRTSHTAVDHSAYLTALPPDPVFNTITAARYLGPTNMAGTERHLLVGQSDHPNHIYHISTSATTQTVTYHWDHTLHENPPWSTVDIDLSAVDEDYLPDTTNTRDIGSPTHQIAQIYANLGRFASTIHAPGINSGTETMSANGTWTFPGTVNFTGTVTGIDTGDTYEPGAIRFESVQANTGIVLEELGTVDIHNPGFQLISADGTAGPPNSSNDSENGNRFMLSNTSRELVYTGSEYTNWAEVHTAITQGVYDGLVARVFIGDVFVGPSGISLVSGSVEDNIVSEIQPISFPDQTDGIFDVYFDLAEPRDAPPGQTSDEELELIVESREGGLRAAIRLHTDGLQTEHWSLFPVGADLSTDTEYANRIYKIAVYGVKFPAIDTARMPTLNAVADADSGTVALPWRSQRAITTYTDAIRPHSGTITVGHTADNLTMNFHDPEFTVQTHETGTWGANNRALASVHARDIRAQTIRNYQGTELILGFNTHTVRVPNGATLDLETGATLDVAGATLTGFPEGLNFEEIWYFAQTHGSPQVTANTAVNMNNVGTWNTGWSAQALWGHGSIKGLAFEIAETRDTGTNEYAASDTHWVGSFGNSLSTRNNYVYNGRVWFRGGEGLGGVQGIYYNFKFFSTGAEMQVSTTFTGTNTIGRHFRLYVIR